MNRFQFYSAFFILFLFAPIAMYAFIGSAYRVHIKGVGTIILLGDQQDAAPEADQEQFDLITEFLKSQAAQDIPTVFNTETIYPAPEYYTDADSRNSMVRNRLSEREIAPNLRAFVATLRALDLNKKILFTSSDPRRSEIWDITKSKKLQSLVGQVLKKDPLIDEKSKFLMIEQDYENVLKKYNRFIKRCKTGLPEPLFNAVSRNLCDRLTESKNAFRECRKFFHKYSNQHKALSEQAIQDIISEFALQKMGARALYFYAQEPEDQELIISTVTTTFQDKIQKKFGAKHSNHFINAPWAMDLFNAFTHHKAKTAVFYANDSHIHYITLFLRSLQKELRDDTVKFEVEFTLAKRPLSREQFAKVLDIKTF